MVTFGGVAQGSFPGKRVSPSVFAKDVPDLDTVSQGLDPLGVDSLELLNIIDDLVDLVRVGFQFICRESESGQEGDLLNLFGAEFHLEPPEQDHELDR